MLISEQPYVTFVNCVNTNMKQPTWANEVWNGTQSKTVPENIGKDGKNAEVRHPRHGTLQQ
jgi:hypothetical protein